MTSVKKGDDVRREGKLCSQRLRQGTQKASDGCGKKGRAVPCARRVSPQATVLVSLGLQGMLHPHHPAVLHTLHHLRVFLLNAGCLARPGAPGR